MPAAVVPRTASSAGMVLLVLVVLLALVVLLVLVVRRAGTLWAEAARRHGTRPAEAAAVLTGAVARR